MAFPEASNFKEEEPNNNDSLYKLQKDILLGAPKMRNYIVLFGKENISDFIDEHLYKKGKEIIFYIFEEEFEKSGFIEKNKGSDLQKSIKYVGSKEEPLDSLKIQESIQSSGKAEVSFFLDFFGIVDYPQFEKKLEEIQTNYKLKKDGILGENTLKVVYLNYYATNRDRLSPNILRRLNIYEEVKKNYNGKKMTGDNREVNPIGIPKVFAKQTYYGAFGEGPKEGAFIEEILFGKISPTISERGNVIKISKIDVEGEDKNYLAFYKNGKLEIATFVSIGENNSEKRTSEETYNIPMSILDIDHVSSEFPKEIKNKEGKIIRPKGGSAMAYAIHVNGGTRIHSSNEIDGEPHSHGCIRTPLYYLRKLYDEVKGNPLNIEIKKLY